MENKFDGIVRKGWKPGTFSAPDSIFDQPDIETTYELAIYLYLCRRADATGQSFPGVTAMARDCRMGRATAFRSLASLERKGLLTREEKYDNHGARTTNIYTIYHPEQRATTAPAPCLPGEYPPSQPETGPVSLGDTKECTYKDYVVVDPPPAEKTNEEPGHAQAVGSNEPAANVLDNVVLDNVVLDDVVNELQTATLEATGARVDVGFFQKLLIEFPTETIREKIDLVGQMGTGTAIRNVPGLIVAALKGNFEHIPGKPQLRSKVKRAGPAGKICGLERRELLKTLYEI